MKTWIQKEPIDNRNVIANKYKHRLKLKAATIEDFLDFEIPETDDDMIATMKYDGELNLAFFDGKKTVFANRYNRLREDTSTLDYITQICQANDIQNAVFAGELFAKQEGVNKLPLGEVMHRIKNPHNKEEEDSIRFAIFDIVELNGEELHIGYQEIIEKLHTLFKPYYYDKEPVFIAETSLWKWKDIRHYYLDAYPKKRIEKLWKKVVDYDQEGLVVRTSKGNFKIKQTFDLDAAVIGLTMTGKSWEREEASALVVALMDESGNFRYAGTVGGGLRPGEYDSDEPNPEKFRKWWYRQGQQIGLEKTKIVGKPVLMIEPKHVIEMRADEWVSGVRPLMSFENGAWSFLGEADSPAGQKPRVIRYRKDKRIHKQDLRLSQLEGWKDD